MKKIIVGTLVGLALIIGFAGCHDSDDKTVDSTSTTSSTTTMSESSKQQQDSSQPQTYKKDEVQVGTQEQEVLQLFQEAFQTTGNVTFNQVDKTYLITPTNPTFVHEMQSILNGELPLTLWTDLVDRTVQLSTALQDELGSGYSIVIVNPFNAGEMFLAVSDGHVLFDGLTNAVTNEEA